MANFLIVDDDPTIVKVLESALQKKGHSCVCANDAFDAIEKVQRETFDLIVCDANMPGYSGFSLVETFRADEKYKFIPVLFLTGRREKKDVIRALKSGADDYLIKPVDFDMFFAKVEALLSGESKGFAYTTVNATADWTAKFQVTGISEQGICFRSDFSLTINMKFKIECDLFDKVGIESPQLRVAGCALESEKEYLIKANFIGLTSGELQKIRQWTMSHQPRKSRNAS